MKRISTLLMIALLIVTAAFAHGGKTHQLLGTVEQLRENHLVVKAKDGHDRPVDLTASTKLEKAGKPATRADLAPGVRVSVHFAEDDKTALLIKISPAAPR